MIVSNDNIKINITKHKLTNLKLTLDLVIFLQEKPEFLDSPVREEWVFLYERPEEMFEVSLSLNQIHNQVYFNELIPIIKYKGYCIALHREKYVLVARNIPSIEIYNTVEEIWDDFIKGRL